MLRKVTAIVLVTLVSSFITSSFGHDLKDPVLSEITGYEDVTQQPVLSEDSVSTVTRQESSVLQDDIPVPAQNLHPPSDIKEPVIDSSQVLLPEALSDDTTVTEALTDVRDNADAIKKEAEQTVLINTNDLIMPSEENVQTAAEELSSERRKDNEEVLPISATSVLHTDVSITLTQTATPAQSEAVKPSIEIKTNQADPDSQEEVTPDSVTYSLDKGDNSGQTQIQHPDDTLQDVKEFIQEAAESTTNDKTENDSGTFTKSEKESAETVTSDSNHDIEPPTVEIPESIPIPPPDEVKGEDPDVPSDEQVKVEVGTPESPDSGEVTHEPQEEFPSFGEWTAKVLAEEEKTKLAQESLGNMPGGAVHVQQKTAKQSRNNYASRDCGAKILGANREAKNTNSILNGNKDDYMTNPCTAKKWFIVELCEPIQVRTFELASFELFSSQPRTFKVHLSDRYPTKDWRIVGTFHATEERSTHPFQIEDEHFSKFVKVEMVDHFREEHFCPLTLFRIFGVDLNYMSEDEDGGHDDGIPNSQDPGDLLSNDDEEEGNPTNLFESAKDTVISLVKKVLKVEDSEKSEEVDNVLGETGNSTALESAGSNVTEDGYPLPCLPDVSIPNGSDPDNSSVMNSSDIEPQEPYPHTTMDDNFVIKLEDHEQLPSPDRLTEPLVTLIDWNYFAAMGNKELAMRCSSCSRNNSTTGRGTTDGRKNCLYVNLLLGNLQQQQSCPTKKRKQRQKPKLEEAVSVQDIPESGIPSLTSSDLKDSQKTIVQEKEIPTETQMPVDPSEKIISSSASEPNFVVVTSTMTPSVSKSLPHSESSPSTSSVNSIAASGTLTSSIQISIIEEPIPASDSVAAGTSVEPTRVNNESEDITMYPQPGQVIIPTASSEVKDVSSESMSKAESDAIAEDNNNNNGEQVQDIELESSYGGTLVSKKAPRDDVSESTTPRLPPLNGDGTVGLSASDGNQVSKGEGTLSQQNGGQSEKAEDVTTDPPAEVTKDTTLVQPTPVDDSAESSLDNKVVKAINQSEARSGEEGKRDLNLVRVPVSPHMKRETAIMRLNNRLKALEMNVSLSSRFLEELSKRYRKQSDDVMKLLNKTMSKLSNTTKLVEEKDQHSRHLIGILEARIDNLTSLVSKLAENVGYLDQKLTERNFTWATMEVVVVLVLLLMSWRRTSSPNITPEVQKLLENMPTGPGPPKRRRRRNSSTGTMGYSSPHPPLIKHSSESALDTQLDFSIVEPLVAAVCSNIKINEGSKKKKKKKHKNLESKSSIFNGIKEVTPSSSSSSNQSSAFSPGAFNGLGKIGPDIDDSCQSYKPRSNSQSGPMNSQQTICMNGDRHKLVAQNSDSSSGSSTSIGSVLSEKDGHIVTTKLPLKTSQSAPFQLPSAKISKSVSAKGLANANVNKNAASKKSQEQWHCRAQSDGNVTLDHKLNYWSNTGKKPPDGAASRRRSTAMDEAKHPLPLVSQTPETLGAFNGTGSVEQSSGKPTSDQTGKGRKWPGGWKHIINIK